MPTATAANPRHNPSGPGLTRDKKNKQQEGREKDVRQVGGRTREKEERDSVKENAANRSNAKRNEKIDEEGKEWKEGKASVTPNYVLIWGEEEIEPKYACTPLSPSPFTFELNREARKTFAQPIGCRRLCAQNQNCGKCAHNGQQSRMCRKGDHGWSLRLLRLFALTIRRDPTCFASILLGTFQPVETRGRQSYMADASEVYDLGKREK